MGLINQAGLFSGAGLVDQAGLYNEAGLYVPGSFSPLSLNPLLAYEAESSMVAPFERPTLDLDPSNPSSLDIITATRAGVATYTDADGVIQSASPNTVRVDHVDGVPMMLIEPSATNLLTQTDFSGGWSLAGSATVEQTTEPTPLPTQTALRLQSNGVISDRYQAPSGYPSGVSTASVYIKWDGVDTRFRIERAVSNSRAEFNVTQGGVTHHSNTADGYSIEEHGDGWWRVSNTMTNPTWVQLYADVEDGDGSILIALPQHEAGSVPTSFIPTSGSTVTRNADNLVIDGTDFTDFYNTDGGTFYVEGVPRSLFNGRYLTVSDATTANRVILYEGNGLSRFFVAKDDATQVFLTNTASSINNLNRIAASYKLNNFLTSANGTQFESPDTSGTPPTSVNRINVGSNEGDVLQLNGHIKRLIYWPYHSDDL